MVKYFGNSDPLEYTYEEDGSVEVESVEADQVEVPDVVEEPETVQDVPPAKDAGKVDRRGKNLGGSDYVFYGDF